MSAGRVRSDRVSAGNYIALLRGINVGGRNMLPMPPLLRVFLSAGCSSARSYIQSGNIVFTAESNVVATLHEVIEKRILDEFGLRVPVILRNRAQMEDAIANNPYVCPDNATETLHICFLADWPEANRVAALDPRRSPSDSFTVRGREIYVHAPTGLGRSKLTNAWFDSKLRTVSTVRNWQTALRLFQMVTDESAPGTIAGTSAAPD